MARVMDRVYSYGKIEKDTQVTGKMVNMMVTGHTLQLMEEKEWVNSEMINLGTSRIMIVLDMLQEAGLKEKKNNG